MHGVVFDLDGTLADTAADLIAAANAVFVHLGHGPVLEPWRDAQVAMQGGGRAMLNYGFKGLGIAKSEQEIEALYPLIISSYGENLCVHSTLFDGCKEALQTLEGAGIALGVCTNKPGALAVPLLHELGIAHHFGALIAADTLAVRKPHPAPYLEVVNRLGVDVNNTVLVGDSVTDRETARAAGVASVLVTFGPLGEQVRSLDPDHLLGHFNDLGDLVADIFAPTSAPQPEFGA